MSARVIWQYWETRGFKPRFVDGLHQIARRNSGCEVVLVTPETLSAFLPEIPRRLFRIKELAHKADMIRAMLLSRHGGMWLDSDAVVLRDLNWLFDLLNESDFVAFNNGGQLSPDRPWVRINCFLSRPNGKVATEWVRGQHGKFPRVTYGWEEIGTEILHPICLQYKDMVRVVPFERICPLPWDRVSEFEAAPAAEMVQAIDACDIVMLSNASLKQRAPTLRTLTCGEIAKREDLAGLIMRRAYRGEDILEPAPANRASLGGHLSFVNISRRRDADQSPPGQQGSTTILDTIARPLKRLRFDNRQFWNRRYATDPEKGSGPGSRCENLTLKNDLIKNTVEKHGIESILDIGCGDIAILEGLQIGSYTGIDISDLIVERNKKLRPEWKFLRANVADSATELPAADLVLCLDVLIHQKSRNAYEQILRRAIAAARRLVLVSGYTTPDLGWNVFFHEPLTRSVSRIQPKARVTHLASYRGTDLLELDLMA